MSTQGHTWNLFVTWGRKVLERPRTFARAYARELGNAMVRFVWVWCLREKLKCITVRYRGDWPAPGKIPSKHGDKGRPIWIGIEGDGCQDPIWMWDSGRVCLEAQQPCLQLLCFSYFSHRSHNFHWGLALDDDPPTCVSHIAGITGMPI
jgi:hypothetical protein